MRQSSSVASWCLALVCAMAISVFATNSARAQAATEDENKVSPTAADQSAADEASVVYRHARPANTPAGAGLKQKGILARRQSSTARANTSSTADNDHLRYPADLTYFGGPVIDGAESHNIYLLPKTNTKCSNSSCWGNPEGFLKDLSGSDFIHLVDQYVGMAASSRYTLGPAKDNVSIKYMPKGAFSDTDMRIFVHAAASKTGLSGYGHIYHVFLPPGQDTCLPSNPSDSDDHICYSPDAPKNFAFCAYHSSVTFTDKVGHVLYTVEPYQDVSGCSVRPDTGTGNGQLADSTNNSLSHELIETITDPDGSAWFNFTDAGLAGEEIGDECSFFVFTSTAIFFDPSSVTLNGHKYAIQPEYSNSEHACATSP